MQVATFEVERLFDRFDHRIDFPQTEEAEEAKAAPSLVILHGPNGIGKTTMLQMMRGFMELKFDPFRRVPFRRSTLTFNTGEQISVTWEARDGAPDSKHLHVAFQGMSVALHPERSGPLERPDDIPEVESFREQFFEYTESLNFELVDTARIIATLRTSQAEEHRRLRFRSYRHGRRFAGGDYFVDESTEEHLTTQLARKVKAFINEAQANYRRFFASTEPDLFPKIIERLTQQETQTTDPDRLLERLEKARAADAHAEELGLASDYWDFEQLADFLERLESDVKGRDYALAVLDAYVETLESRQAERQLVADRLLTFQKLINEFLENKRIRVHARDGISIKLPGDGRLGETELSSGEYHLVYLMVSALVSQRRGTVIAIDEPEMSMHLEWQRKLIPALLEIARKAQPQFIFATHSPDIAAEYAEHMVDLGATE